MVNRGSLERAATYKRDVEDRRIGGSRPFPVIILKPRQRIADGIEQAPTAGTSEGRRGL